jgi:hypothetical protein
MTRKATAESGEQGTKWESAVLMDGMVQSIRAWHPENATAVSTLCHADAVRMVWGLPGLCPDGSRLRREFIVHRPTSMLAVVPQLTRSDLRLEIEIEIDIEVVAAVAPVSATTGQDA